MGVVLRRLPAAMMAMAAAVTGWPAMSEAQTVSREQVVAALPKLEALAEAAARNALVPGIAIAVVHDDTVVYAKGFGRRAMGRPEPVDADTVFQIASLSKSVSSTVIASLVSDGVVTWDSRIADLDPSFRLLDPYPTSQLTIRDLFAHRSGLPGSAGNDLEDIGYKRAETMRRLRFVPPSSSFRAGYSYSNAGLTEGALAAVRPTGKVWEDVAQERLFRALGMASSSYRHADFLTRSNRALLHVRSGGAWAAKIERNPDEQAPAGGVSSNVRDLAQWMRLELADGVFDGKRLIADAAFDRSRRMQMPLGNNPVTGEAAFYGLGWNSGFGRHGLRWGHAGAFSVGAQTVVALYPRAKLGIVVLTNAFASGVPDGLADSFADLAFDGKLDKDWFKPWGELYRSAYVAPAEKAAAEFAKPPAATTPALPLQAYEGRYANDYFGDAIVAADKGALTMKLGPDGARVYTLRHFDRDTFLIFPEAETPDRPYPVQFAIGPGGRAAGVKVEWLDDTGLGTFARRAE